MANYDERKQKYEALNDSQKQMWNDKVSGMDSGAEAKQFTDRYNQEQNQTNNQTPTQSNFSNNQTTTPTVQKTENQTTNQNKQTYNYDPNEKLDTSMFGASDGKVKVQEGTAKQTGQPDYMLDSDARTREITDNLNAYRQTNREYFSDRTTYNNMFHYNERSDQQKAVLDSYWKKKEDVDNASKYNTGTAIGDGMKNAEITTDQLNYIKEMSPEAYREWQQKQQDDINLRIANMATPRDETNIASLFNSLVEKLNLEPGDPYQIYDNWYDMAERLGVFSDSEKLRSYQSQLDDNHSKMESIMSRYAASTGGAVSDALAAARMQKALAPYQQREVDLQNSYTALLNGRNSNLAIANQSATALAMQAQEDQRIFNQKLSGLGFAMETAAFRTPEQQAQLSLQTQQLQSDMQLLQQSMANDLNLYNQYATFKLQNKLQNELTDLNVEDEDQLRANLNNALSGYYEQYGDIIQRSQAQAVDDIIAYAKEKGISVAEALTQNFLKPLQGKKEYKAAVCERYGLDKYQQQYSYTIDENGNVVIQATGYGEIPEDAFKTRASRQEAYGDVYDTSGTWSDYIENLAGAIKDGSYGGQCGAFCNDVLLAGDDSKVFGNSLEDKIKACNVDKDEGPQVGYAVVFDLGFTSKDGINHGHVGFVSAVNGDGSIDVLESNGKSDETIHIKRYSKAMVDKMVKGYYKPSNFDIQKEAGISEVSSDPYSGVSKITTMGAEVNSGGWISDLENEYIKEKWDNKDVMNQTLSSYGITLQDYNAQKKKYLDYQAKVTLIEETQRMYDAVQDLLTWNQEHSSNGLVGSKHSGVIDNATYESIQNGTPVKNILGVIPKWATETANGINKYNYLKNSQLLEKYQQLKKAGATFGAMQKSEWDLVGSAASKLNWKTSDAEFEATLTEMLNHYGNILAEAGVEGFYNTDI